MRSRILIISQYPLFDQGIRTALDQQPGVEVVGKYPDPTTALEPARTLSPDVVVVIAEAGEMRESAFRLLEDVAPCLIRISPTDGSMQVYERRQVDRATLEDLMNAIRVASEALVQGELAKEPPALPKEEPSPHSQWRRANMKHLVTVAVLVAAVTAIVATGLSQMPLLPPLASEEGMLVDRMFRWQILVIAFLFSLIVVFILYSIVVFRRRPGEEGEGTYIRGNTTLEVIWTLLPLGTVLFFATWAAQDLNKMGAPESQELVVEVTAFQFGWRFDYPEYGITSNELNLPRDRQVLFKLTSQDVIHSFWVPEFRIKQDTLPGQVKTLRIKPTKDGEYVLRCAELCGTGHAYMLGQVNVMEPTDFEAWVAGQTAPAGELSLVEQGAQIATTQGCLGCHSTDGTTLVGPTWQGLYGSERTLTDGTTVVADEAYLREAIVDPNARLVQGFPANVMPADYGDRLSAEEIDALIAYIQSLGQ